VRPAPRQRRLVTGGCVCLFLTQLEKMTQTRVVGTQRVQLTKETLDPLTANSFAQHTLRRKGLLPPAHAERFRHSGHLHDQTMLAVADGTKW